MGMRGEGYRAMREGWHVMGTVIFVLAVVAFWALVFCLMMLFIRMISRGRDNEEVACDVTDESYILDKDTVHAPPQAMAT